MKALLNDLMEFTTYRLGGGLSLATEPLQLDHFARNTLDEIGAVFAGRALVLESQGDMAGEWDPRRLHQALSNLVFNALKYGFADTPVRVGLDGTHQGEVQLTVRNTGRPIAPHVLPRLFDPLVREERDVQEDGPAPEPGATGANLGLGLYVVRQIALAHGGSVEVSSDKEATEFRMRLPRMPGVHASAGQASAGQASALPRPR